MFLKATLRALRKKMVRKHELLATALAQRRRLLLSLFRMYWWWKNKHQLRYSDESNQHGFARNLASPCFILPAACYNCAIVVSPKHRGHREHKEIKMNRQDAKSTKSFIN